MSVYIKKLENNKVILGGFIGQSNEDELLEDGFELVDCLPPTLISEDLLWDEENQTLIENPDIELYPIRKERDRLLKETDWIVIKSIETGEIDQEWVDYRNALRDVPQNHVLGEEVVWPEKPNKK